MNYLAYSAAIGVLSASMTVGAEHVTNSDSKRQPKSEQEWLDAVSDLRAEMPLEECEAVIRRALKTDFLVDIESASGGGYPVTAYTLDENWRLLVLHDSKKMFRFWVSGIDQLQGDIDKSLFALVKAIHQTPRFGSTKVDPTALVRAVNTLHAAGFDRALEALWEYDELFHRYLSRRELRHYDLDHQRIFLIGHLLFVRKDGKRQFPIPALGAEVPMFQFLQGSDFLDKVEHGDADWPYFPVALSDDVPFVLVRGFTLFGRATEPKEFLEFVETHCRLRERPLEPSDAPWKAMEELLASPAARREKELQSEGRRLLQRQVLWALLPASDAGRQTEIKRFLARSDRGGRALTDDDWRGLCDWFSTHKAYWDAERQCYRRGLNDPANCPPANSNE